METTSTELSAETIIIKPAQLLKHWQGHRSLTRRVIEAFPEKELFSYSIGGMRPFAQLAMEMLGMAVPGVQGVVTGKWDSGENVFNQSVPLSKKELLDLWDEATAQVNDLWEQIPAERFQQVDLAFGLYEGPMYYIIFYFIDNEIHHRGQGYVYLRSLGIEPPPFWDRPV